MTDPAPSHLDELRKTLADDIRAYPGTLTYIDLIRKNKRQSMLLIGLMFILTAAVGALIAIAITIWVGVDTQRGQEVLVGAAAAGIVAGLLTALIMTLWSWSSGAGAILRMSGARQITPQDDPELFNVVDEMRIAAGLPMPSVYLVKDSAMNAFATGRDPEHAAVVITTGLREKLTRDELQGVIAHEMAHVRHLDIRFSMLMATMVGLIVFACDALLRVAWYSGGTGRSRRSSNSNASGAIVLLVLALVLAVIAPFLARVIQMAYSRQREYLADAGAVELTRNPQSLASALSKLAGDHEPLVDRANRGTAHLYIINPLRKMRSSGQSLNSMLSSHPPVKERIARLLALTR